MRIEGRKNDLANKIHLFNERKNMLEIFVVSNYNNKTIQPAAGLSHLKSPAEKNIYAIEIGR
ncbi:MAG: hypothetical protein LBJ78_04535 [Puniceicoccales bacterium]|jgi:hypothetical protein|nr:hypothetical protein [Puniceicoccales bacterium]